MKIFELRPTKDLDNGDNPWDPWYDKSFGFIVRATNEKEARLLAHENAGDENRGLFLDREIAKTQSPWVDEKYSTCVELKVNGEVCIIMKDFAQA